MMKTSLSVLAFVGALATANAQTWTGSIDYNGEADDYTLSAVGGTTYDITVTLNSLSDSKLYVLDSNGQQLAYNDDYGGNLASFIAWTAPYTGSFTIEVRGYGSATGSYTVTATSDNNPCSGGIQLNEAQGDIFFSDSYDNYASCTWTITCPYGTPHLSFETFETEANFDYVNVYDGSSTSSSQVFHNSGSMWNLPTTTVDGSSSSMVVEFTADGSVTGQGFDAGYVCSGGNSGGSSGGAITLDQSMLVNVVRQQNTDYTLSATGGQTYQIEVTLDGTLSDSVLYVLDSAQNQLVYDDDGGDGLGSYTEWTAPNTANYIVRVAGYGSSAGTAHLMVSSGSEPCSTAGSSMYQSAGNIFFSDAYDNGQACTWTITCPSGNPTLTFQSFQTEANFDYVDVYDGASTYSQQISHQSGSFANLRDTSVSATGGSMVVQFTSDYSVTGQGFDASWNCGSTNNNCQDDPYWTGQYGDCESYTIYSINHPYCESDGATGPCPAACGVCY